MTFEIQYTDGLTVSITVTADPGTGGTWLTDHPIISWGDETETTGATTGTTYTHTYPSYATYAIQLDANIDECDATSSDTKSVTLVEPCPEPTLAFEVVEINGLAVTVDVTVCDPGSGAAWTTNDPIIHQGSMENWIQNVSVGQYVFMCLGSGTHDIYLEGTNNCVNSASVYLTVTVAEFVCPVPTCGFSIN